MQLLRSLVLAANACSFVNAFAPPAIHTPTTSRVTVSPLHAATETDVERLLRKARELREAATAGEAELHSDLIQKKKTRDAATDSMIAHLFPSGGGEDGVCALCDRLRKKRLASDMLVQIVERLHEREVAARGLEHVEPSVHHDQVSFKRVAQPNEAELSKIQGLVDRLIEAAEVLDKEFIEQKSECGGVVTHSDIMHWGGGDISGILKDKAKELGREHDEQFQKRLQSFYEAANRKHSREEVDENSWRDGDVWSP
mmetsp:Transcript_26949/g.45914  ORF Transcript_26949/g.45914 Transcript_26949/m.45914 type:complete len:256 (-) Transcript_26949:316-1083(-)|eukprot:CAMPEP_0183723838 /NCGR_PEP_ID=MMETSP0737-20130205/16479_1 /TAXON_ID=385413 /ORGANISM="Thalassiosira miniscula, Strain CCMP1093" /LENGTH=255 /DNA_ID=CAMNT_0025954223 /DNA_START=106 /DNA_END=873 /DNA_ORIENTATION=+